MSMISLKKLKQEENKLKASLGYTTRQQNKTTKQKTSIKQEIWEWQYIKEIKDPLIQTGFK